MNSSSLLNDISSSLKLPKDINETKQDWEDRLIYSAVGKMSLASLWDNEEQFDFISNDKMGVSITHYKTLIAQRIDAFFQVMGIKERLESISVESVTDEIFETYSITGFFYHEPHRISPSICRNAVYGNLKFIRDCNPSVDYPMCGLGYYDNSSEPSNVNELCDIFHLPQSPYKEWFYNYIKTCKWDPVNLPQDTEYLRTKPPFTKGYWIRTLSVSEDRITLCRYGFTGQKIYLLVRKTGGTVFGCQLPGWMTGLSGHAFNHTPQEYFRIALAILMMEESLPPVRVHKSDKLITIELPYILPTEEEMFYKLYSWPVSLEQEAKSMFIRKMDINVFSCFKMLLEFYGFQF